MGETDGWGGGGCGGRWVVGGPGDSEVSALEHVTPVGCPTSWLWHDVVAAPPLQVRGWVITLPYNTLQCNAELKSVDLVKA